MPVLLVADEDSRYRTEICGTFEGSYRVVEAEDNKAALDCVFGAQQDIDVILLSMTLDGTQDAAVLDAMQKKKGVWNISIVATGPADMLLEEKALGMGASDYASKPHTQKSIYRRVLRATAIAALRERERVLRNEAFQDSLTGLLNRRGMESAIETMISGNMLLAVCLFDVDCLKEINDTFGHLKGDQVLLRVGMLLRSQVREMDLVSRFGGDEFIIVIKIKSAESAEKKGEEICRSIQNNIDIGQYRVSVSAGVALWDKQDPVMEAVARADQALYWAKQHRKGGCCLWKKENE